MKIKYSVNFSVKYIYYQSRHYGDGQYTVLDAGTRIIDDLYSALIYAYKFVIVDKKYIGSQHQVEIKRVYCSPERGIVYENILIFRFDKPRCARVILRHYRKYKKLKNAACLIQAQFRESISNPAYQMCRRRLMREFNEINKF